MTQEARSEFDRDEGPRAASEAPPPDAAQSAPAPPTAAAPINVAAEVVEVVGPFRVDHEGYIEIDGRRVYLARNLAGASVHVPASIGEDGARA